MIYSKTIKEEIRYIVNPYIKLTKLGDQQK